MSLQTQVSELLNKKMDRQDFIKHVAVAAVAMSGVGAALRVFSPAQKQQQNIGYGGSTYGGVKNVG